MSFIQLDLVLNKKHIYVYLKTKKNIFWFYFLPVYIPENHEYESKLILPILYPRFYVSIKLKVWEHDKNTKI